MFKETIKTIIQVIKIYLYIKAESKMIMKATASNKLLNY